MKKSDRNLGMNRVITRRDLLHGAGSVAAAAFVPGQAFAEQMLAAEQSGAGVVYPPALTGMRGNHVGSFEVAHQLAREGRRDWGPVEEPDADIYDLVVVGAGISGLAAAHFYRKKDPDARILILDNHDDFGGHAKRNEFKVGDRTLIGYGGSQTMEEPSGYRDLVKSLLKDLGVDPQRFYTAYDQEFFKRHGLRSGIFFDKKNWGVDQLVPFQFGEQSGFIPFAPPGLSTEDAINSMPMSESARREFLYLVSNDTDRLDGIPQDSKADYLYSISYRDFLSKHLGITEQEVFDVLQYMTADSGPGIESTPASGALGYSGLPGGRSTGLTDDEEYEPYIHHFPDGNASIARLLVRQMIPPVAPGSTMEDIVTADFDYGKLDVGESPVRLRLNSTVVNVAHEGNSADAKSVTVSYVRNSQACRVRAKKAILACYNSIIPAMCPELPARQREALLKQVKTPMLYTSVGLNNWRAWETLGFGGAIAPTSYHRNVYLDFPVSLGDYKFAANPDEPIMVHLDRFPARPNEGLSVREQLQLGRHELYATPFETIERNIRNQLAAMLAGADFDPARDIAGITVNRWAHGYADSFGKLGDPWYSGENNENYPHVIGRKPYGRISIANSDSGALAMMETAIEQAHRAVNELT